MHDRDPDEYAVHPLQPQLGREELVGSCPMPFDEGRMWKGGEGPALIAELQDAFRNITCVCHRLALVPTFFLRLQGFGQQIRCACFCLLCDLVRTLALPSCLRAWPGPLDLPFLD